MSKDLPLRVPAASVLLALMTVLAGPAASASAGEEHDHSAPPAAPAAAPTVVPPAGTPAPALPALVPDPDQTVEELQTQADLLAQQVAQQQAEVAAEKQRLAHAEAAAAATLEDYQLAQREADEAARAAAEEGRRLVAATLRTERALAALNEYVGSLFRQGMGNERMSVYNSLLGSRSPDAFISGLGLAERVGSNRGGELVQLADLQAEQQLAADRAQAAEQASREASERAAEARLLADQVVNQASRAVLQSTETLLRTQGAAAAAAQMEAERRALMAKAEEIARQRAAIPYAAIEGALIPRPAAECRGKDIDGYPNGMLPPRALCPLWGTSGHMLRADAAAGFNAMSHAYAAVFGAPICVTDSYRTYDEQVAVKAAKPDLAAQPGTSNHGWALAVDLCDGVQSFGTATHDWLRRNSLRYGWFLPAWAMETGSKPEPWHWEFAG